VSLIPVRGALRVIKAYKSLQIDGLWAFSGKYLNEMIVV